MIEKFNAWMEKVGVDKMLHFFVAAWVVAECKIYGVMWGCIGFAVIAILALVKEMYIDKKGDLTDALGSLLGGGLSLILMALYDAL